jgi:hypothetical protein
MPTSMVVLTILMEMESMMQMTIAHQSLQMTLEVFLNSATGAQLQIETMMVMEFQETWMRFLAKMVAL